MRTGFILLFTFWLTSCAILSQSSVQTIPFSEVEKVIPGKSTKNDIRLRFGTPDRVLHRSSTQEAWIYQEKLDTGVMGQKASFSFEADLLVGALWIPNESDPLENASFVQAHFKGAKFIRKVKGWDQQGHSYSDDVTYYDAERGILFTTGGRDQTVSAIGFNLPSAERNVSSQR